MNCISKYSISLLLFTISIHQLSAQDSLTAFNETWAGLKADLQRRTVIATNLATMIEKSKESDKEQIAKIKTTAKAIDSLVNISGTLNSPTIHMLTQKNNALTQALARSLVMLERDAKFRAKQGFQDILMQLEGIENRIAVAINSYNDVCKRYKRLDLVYSSPVNPAPAVKF